MPDKTELWMYRTSFRKSRKNAARRRVMNWCVEIAVEAAHVAIIGSLFFIIILWMAVLDS